MTYQLPTRKGARRSADRAQDFLLDAEKPVGEQHTISRTVSKNFGELDAHGVLKVGRYSLEFGPQAPKPPRGIGKTPHFIRVASASAERLWSTVENDLPNAVKTTGTKEVLRDPVQLQVLRDAVSLHYVRSPVTMIVLNRAWETQQTSGVDRIIAEHGSRLRAEFLARHGFSATNTDLRSLVLEYASRTAQLVESGGWARARLEELFHDTRELAAQMSVQILHAGEGEFLLGDSPAVTWRPGTAAPGVLGGTPWLAATKVFLPLTPTLTVCLADEPAYETLSLSRVNELNELQVLAARKFAYHRPSSNAGDFIRSLRPPAQSIASRDGARPG